ncbi:hypothetical protein TNIN_88931 [Trichonephila inaurata madagascariensis]|uniref:Uncharacterized protein n=1 Tax=Trichonephila inaurata madagascariensis TaxID=2747483 RepID=A0A8X6X6X0_9ARAC|nr:hypothetical protein TNIN_88931 [Trichonephila inaurata madagascariensis]
MKFLIAVIFACALATSSGAYLPTTYLGGYGYPYALATAPALSYAAVPAALPVAIAAPAAPIAAPAAAGYVRYETPNFAYSYAHPVGYLKK